MAFQKPEPKSVMNERQREWFENALAFAKEKGANENGELGYLIRKGDKEIGNRWIDWLWANNYRDAARAIGPQTRQGKPYMVPCRNPDEFALWLNSRGIETRKAVRLPAPAKEHAFLSVELRDPDFRPEAVENAIRKCRGQFGRIARDQGWLTALFEFVRDTGDLPNEEQTEELKALAAKASAVIANPPGILQGVASAMAHKRANIEQLIFGQAYSHAAE